ncbi:hypothetical protein V494_00226 [Pseudogymnoascus sp. VKM F-4513 (FW-928)]|nr:hypothetical protein V494_00226 [Pseudogymnoascus sp. VKM F-4513 (FW-928)]
MESKTPSNKCLVDTKPATKDIFMTWKGFTNAITQAFGDIDAKRTVERTLSGLTQKGSAVFYTAQFQQYANRTDWNDEALKNQYYRGLKDFIKDEMARSDRPNNLREMIEMSQKIDNQHYERKLEKGGHQPAWTHRKPKQKGY